LSTGSAALRHRARGATVNPISHEHGSPREIICGLSSGLGGCPKRDKPVSRVVRRQGSENWLSDSRPHCWVLTRGEAHGRRKRLGRGNDTSPVATCGDPDDAASKYYFIIISRVVDAFVIYCNLDLDLY